MHRRSVQCLAESSRATSQQYSQAAASSSTHLLKRPLRPPPPLPPAGTPTNVVKEFMQVLNASTKKSNEQGWKHPYTYNGDDKRLRATVRRFIPSVEKNRFFTTPADYMDSDDDFLSRKKLALGAFVEVRRYVPSVMLQFSQTKLMI